MQARIQRGAGFGSLPAVAHIQRAPAGWICFINCGAVRAAAGFLFVAGRCGLRATPVRCGLGCGPRYVKKYAGRGGVVRMYSCGAGAGSTFSARAVSLNINFAYCLCLLVGDSSVCVCVCVRACGRACVRACVCACVCVSRPRRHS